MTPAQKAQKTLAEMQRASGAFYVAARETSCHAFIEFTGLMNEFIKVCGDASARGDHSWLDANTHSDRPLQMEGHQVAYLAEKLDCIYGATLRANPQLAATFGFELARGKASVTVDP